MNDMINGLGATYNASIRLEYIEGYPATVNQPAAYEEVMRAARQIAGPSATQMAPCMGGEDFSYYLQKIPGCFFFVGSSPEGHPAGSIPHHSSNFDINEKALLVGASMYLQLIDNLLIRK